MNNERRRFLQTLGAAGAMAALPTIPFFDLAARAAGKPRAIGEAPGICDFVFFTDTHIQPELDAAHGCRMAFAKIAASKPEFAICGGDLVFDATEVGRTRADQLFDLYQRSEEQLKIPLYHAIGNHDLFGTASKSGIASSDPGYGKKMYEDRIGARTYYSFDRRGYHFIVLDSIFPMPDGLWEGRIDAAQMQWLGEDLARVGAEMPVIVITHVPLVTGYLAYGPRPDGTQRYNVVSVANSADIMNLFDGHNVLGVLQGHLHINELVTFRNRQYATCGAVCGNWWHGPRLAFPEGYTLVRLRNGKMSWEYETYGFKSVDPCQKC